jgi:putative ABC transport system permease protein
VTGGGEAERVEGLFVSADLFPTLGVQPALGRAFSAEEDKAGAEPVVVLGHGLWQRRFGGDPGVVGKPLVVAGQPMTVIGVMPAGFEFQQGRDLWLPLAQNPIVGRGGRMVRFLSVVGRLAPGATVEGARAEVAEIARRLAEQHPEANTGLGATIVPLHEQVVGKVRPAFLMLLAAVGFVVLIACANVANLLLTRASARQREIAVRLAMGASRWRVARQLLTESLLLAALGGVAGLLLAIWGVDLLLALAPANLPRVAEVGIDARVLAATALVTLSTGLIFGLAPALQGMRLDLTRALKDGERGADGSGRRLRSLLVVSEIAVALTLLIGSGLLVRSLVRVVNEDPGFDTERVLTVSLILPSPKYDERQARAAYWERLEGELASLPGVEAVGAVTRLPLLSGDITSALTVEGRAVAAGEEPEVDFRRASAGYFATMGIPLLDGRALTDADGRSEQAFGVVNEAMASRFWPGESAVGKRVKLGPNPDQQDWITVAGVVGNVRHSALDVAPRPEVYLNYHTSPLSSPIVVVKASGDPAGVAAAVRARVREVDAEVPVFNVSTTGELASRSVAQRRFSTVLLGAFAAVALAMAVLGLYGVMSYTVVRQTREFGIRMALGAEARDVVGLVLRRSLRIAVAGVAAGLVASLALSRLVSGLLYGVSATDGWTYVAMASLLAVTAIAASLVPAWRASRVDPAVALRYE